MGLNDLVESIQLQGTTLPTAQPAYLGRQESQDNCDNCDCHDGDCYCTDCNEGTYDVD